MIGHYSISCTFFFNLFKEPKNIIIIIGHYRFESIRHYRYEK